jgi:hypothetical protein
MFLSIFWQKGPPLQVNCQKGPPPSEIAKKDHLRRDGKLHQTTRCQFHMDVVLFAKNSFLSTIMLEPSATYNPAGGTGSLMSPQAAARTQYERGAKANHKILVKTQSQILHICILFQNNS